MSMINIEVYGGINDNGGGCGCGCATCTPEDAKAEYEAMKKDLLDKYDAETLSLIFIDTDGANLAAYPEVEKVIHAGYSFPVTVINGAPRLAGAISTDFIIEIITELTGTR